MKNGWLGSRIARLRAILVAGLMRWSRGSEGKLSLLSPFPNLQVCGGRGWNPSILSMEQQVLEEGLMRCSTLRLWREGGWGEA